jgi:hypothetical protein
MEIQRAIERPLPIFASCLDIRYKHGTSGEFRMGTLFDRKPNTYAPPPPQNALPPTFLGQSPSPETMPATNGRTIVAVDLPGRPGAHLDSEFAPKIDAFVRYIREAGHDITVSSADRTQAEQDKIISSGTGRTPAEKSLHSAGLAVDIDKFDDFPAAKKLAIRQAAERAGLSWGGTWPKPDTIHFYFDPIPGQDRTELINNFAEQVRRRKSKQ